MDEHDDPDNTGWNPYAEIGLIGFIGWMIMNLWISFLKGLH